MYEDLGPLNAGAQHYATSEDHLAQDSIDSPHLKKAISTSCRYPAARHWQGWILCLAACQSLRVHEPMIKGMNYGG